MQRIAYHIRFIFSYGIRHLHAAQTRSSIARRLGIETAGMVAGERDVEGVVGDDVRRHAELRGATER